MTRRALAALVASLVALPATASADVNTRLTSLERRVQELKEKSWILKKDWELLRQRVLGANAVTTIVHEDKMGRSFRLMELDYVLDGQRILSRGGLDGARVGTLPVLAQALTPGEHQLSVVMKYRGHGYGVFDYFRRYRFTVPVTQTFTVPDSGTVRVIVQGYESGDVTTPLRERPAARVIVVEGHIDVKP